MLGERYRLAEAETRAMKVKVKVKVKGTEGHYQSGMAGFGLGGDG